MDTLFPIEEKEEYVILSASRMTDMPKYYPLNLIREVEKRINKGLKVHTLVLWTKHPGSLISPPLYEFLQRMKSKGIQLYAQLTITGMGGISASPGKKFNPLILEPNSPHFEESLSLLPAIVDLVGKPERIRIRIDPIIRITDTENKIFSNLKYLPVIVEAASIPGISIFSFSFLEKGMHKKVDRRFDDLGVNIVSPDDAERENTVNWLQEIENKFNVKIFACAVPGLKISKCIDGDLLERLHDKHLTTGKKQPFKRKLCGCSESIDLGGWPPKKCYTGCQYCYSRSSY